MEVFVLSVIAIVCAAKWWANHIAAEALVYYMKKRGYEPATKEEIEACIRAVVARKLGKNA